MTAARQVEVRNLKFEVGDEVPRYWLGGRRTVTTFFNNLSIFFPAGERFFITSVKAHAEYAKDPVLQEHVRNFYAQEGYHGREHVRYNQMLRTQGYPVDAMEGRVIRLLGYVKRLVPVRLQLGVTCGLEHLTALLAHLILENPDVMGDAHPEMAKLWRWHAAEESEHKAVAFDVFTAAGGSYPERVASMVAASAIFWLKVVEQQIRMMRVDGTLFSASEWKSLADFFVENPGGMDELIPLYLDYYRRDFHPWQHDNQALLDEWKTHHASDPSYANAATA